MTWSLHVGRRPYGAAIQGVFILAGLQQADARTLMRLKNPVWGCFNPSIAAVINDASNPKRSDPAWVAKTSEMGECVTITPRSVWEPLTADRDGFTYVAYRGTTAKPGSFWVPTASLVSLPPEVAPPPPPPPPPVEVKQEPLPATEPTNVPAPSPSEAYTRLEQQLQAQPAPPPEEAVQPSAPSPAPAPASDDPPPSSGGGGGVFGTIAVLGLVSWVLATRGRKKRKVAATKGSASARRASAVAPPPVVRTSRSVPSPKVGKADPAPTAPIPKAPVTVPTPVPQPIRNVPKAPQAQAARPAPVWYPPGLQAQICNHRIGSGMIYVGSVSSRSGSEDGCAIDPALEVASSGASGKLPYWPSYAGLSPEGRRGYLDWLASGRQAPDADVGFVFLFFYGLERRLLLERPPHAEVGCLLLEVERLRRIYGRDNSFDGYSRRLLEAIALIRGEAFGSADRIQAERGHMSLALKVAVGREVAAGRPLGFALASAVLLGLDEFRPNGRLVLGPGRQAFLTLLKSRFDASFPNGFPVRNRKDACLQITYRGAMAGLTVDLAARAGLGGLPDPAALTWTKLLALGEESAKDIEPYAKILTDHPEQANSLAAFARCPLELRDFVAVEARQWIKGLASGAAVPFADVARHAIGATGAKWTMRHRRQIAEVLAAGGLGMEPDPDDGGVAMEDGTSVYLFPSTGAQSRAMTVASAAATLVAHLGRGGRNSPESVAETWLDRLSSRLRLLPGEATRLSARLAWLRDAEFSMARLKRSLGDATAEENEFCVWTATVAASASGTVDGARMALLERIAEALHVPRGFVYGTLHADAAASAVPADDPIEVTPEVRDEGHAIRCPETATTAPSDDYVQEVAGKRREATVRPVASTPDESLSEEADRASEEGERGVPSGTTNVPEVADAGRLKLIRILAKPTRISDVLRNAAETGRLVDAPAATQATTAIDLSISTGPGDTASGAAPAPVAPADVTVDEELPEAGVRSPEEPTPTTATPTPIPADVHLDGVSVDFVPATAHEAGDVPEVLPTDHRLPDFGQRSSNRHAPGGMSETAEIFGAADLERARRRCIREETTRVAVLLDEVFVEEEKAAPLKVADDGQGAHSGLDANLSALVARLLERPEWPRPDYDEAARAFGLMPDGAMEAINEWAFDSHGDALLEDGDTVLVNIHLLQRDADAASAAE